MSALADSLFSEKTFNSQHAEQFRDFESLACLIDEVTHNGLLFRLSDYIVSHRHTRRKKKRPVRCSRLLFCRCTEKVVQETPKNQLCCFSAALANSAEMAACASVWMRLRCSSLLKLSA